MIKRHYGASLRDWFGAAEYALVEGNEKIIYVKESINTTHHRSTSRFLLDLQVVPAAKEITHLPIVVDPSHATFWRPWSRTNDISGSCCWSTRNNVGSSSDPKNSAVDPLQPIDYKDFSNLLNKIKKIAKISNKRLV